MFLFLGLALYCTLEPTILQLYCNQNYLRMSWYKILFSRNTRIIITKLKTKITHQTDINVSYTGIISLLYGSISITQYRQFILIALSVDRLILTYHYPTYTLRSLFCVKFSSFIVLPCCWTTFFLYAQYI